MNPDSTLPRALRVVAFVQLFFGVSAVVEIVARLLQGGFMFAFGVLGIPICFGLLRLSRPWRTCCVALLVVGLVMGSLAVLLTLVGSSPGYLDLFGVTVATAPRVWIAIVGILLLILTSWQLRVLVRPDVTRLFLARSGQQAHAADRPQAAGG